MNAATSTDHPYMVLIVDDIKHERDMLKDLVKEKVPNCEFAEAGSVSEAIDVLHGCAFPFDLAIIDIRLVSNAEGLKLLAPNMPIRCRIPYTRVIACSAILGVEIACAAYEAGADVFLSKTDVNFRSKLQDAAARLLSLRDMRNDLGKQHQRHVAAQDFADTNSEILQQYAGKFVLMHGKTLISASDKSEDLWDFVQELVVVKVPEKRGSHG